MNTVPRAFASLLVTLALFLQYSRVASLSCDCEPIVMCPELNCTGNVIPKGAPVLCGCCPVCARQHGKTCGGMWLSGGVCDEGLVCVPPKHLYHDHGTIMKYSYSYIGICKPCEDEVYGCNLLVELGYCNKPWRPRSNPGFNYGTQYCRKSCGLCGLFKTLETP